MQGEFLSGHDKVGEQPTSRSDYSTKPQRLQGWPGQLSFELIFCLFCIIIFLSYIHVMAMLLWII